MSPRRPLLRYLGGKWKLAPWIISHFPRHRTYVESFGGGASVLLRKPRERGVGEIYNDLDGDLVNLFRVLRDRSGAAELERLVRLTPYAREEFMAAYEPTEEPVERARRLLVRSFMGYGSCGSRPDRTTGWRTGIRLDSASAGRDWANYPENIAVLHQRIQGVHIEHESAFDLLRRYDAPGVLHYVDPPYIHETRSKKRTRQAPSNGYRHELDDDDHRELLALLRELKGHVVLSGYAHPMYDSALSDWTRATLRTFADGAAAREEVLWLNPLAAAAGLQGNLFGGAA